VAKVSSNGTVKCRKKGNAVITATIGGKKVGCAVSVVSAKMLKVIKRAEKIGSTWTYSQPKRMQSGYYDCSSLVWKAYSLMGKKFGLANYAPVAADLAKWCKQHGKSLTKSYTSKDIQKMRFNPGDLMFETGSNNGRYKGIYHVEMFVGYRVYSYSKNGTPQLVERWAARPDNYYEGGGWMMRP
jgi:cell wall-associated NlpC family hydrolase